MVKSLWNDIRISLSIRKTSPALLYHFIERSPAEMRGNTDAVLLDDFRTQILRLKKRFQFVFIDELMERLEAGESTAKLACITFDDGTRSVINNALPILADWGIPSTVFLNSSLVQGDIFWRDKVKFIMHSGLVSDFIAFARPQTNQIREDSFYADTKNASRIDPLILTPLLNVYLKTRPDFQTSAFHYYAGINELNGVTTKFVQWGNHSATHYNLAGLSLDAQRAEINDCKQFLETHFTELQRSRVFAIPFGDNKAFNEDTIQALKQCHYKWALITQSDRYLNAGSVNYEVRNGLRLYNRFMPRHYTFRFI